MFWWGLLLGLIIGLVVMDLSLKWLAKEERYRTGKLNAKEKADFQESLAKSKLKYEKDIAEMIEQDRAKAKLKKSKK